MASINKREKSWTETHEGGKAKKAEGIVALRRAVMACLLWEDEFYESGVHIANRIMILASEIKAHLVKSLAVEARQDHGLRHVPLLLLVSLAMRGENIRQEIPLIVTRADQMGELLALWKLLANTNAKGKKPIPRSMKKGLRDVFVTFNAYQLAKYDRASADFRIRDVMFLVEPKPVGKEKEKLFKQVADQNMPIPNTWETRLSEGEDKLAVWTSLMSEKKLGALAFIRNLRNMEKVGVNRTVVRNYLKTIDSSKVFPFQWILAAIHAEHLEADIQDKFLASAQRAIEVPLTGRTAILVDVSYSMVGVPVSKRSEMDRLGAAAALAAIFREVCEDPYVYTFSNVMRIMPNRRGFNLVGTIQSQGHGGTNLGDAVTELNREGFDRIIVLTDEQSHDQVPQPKGVGYMINVGSYDRAVSYGEWNSITGWSEAIPKWISALEDPAMMV